MAFTFDDLQRACQSEWDAYIKHDFVRQLGNGTLSEDAFRHYLKQDYLFLIQFGRAYALAAYKSPTLEDLRQAKAGLEAIIGLELGLHIEYCRQWGISEEELQALPEARATLAYTRYVLDTGSRGDLLDLHVALVPCLIGYAQIGKWLAQRSETVRGDSNPYEHWMRMYESDDFQQAAAAELEWLNRELAEVSPRRFEQLVRIFRDATRLEIDFWDQGLNQSM